MEVNIRKSDAIDMQERQKKGVEAVHFLQTLPEVKQVLWLQWALREIQHRICHSQIHADEELTPERRREIERNLGLMPLPILDED